MTAILGALGGMFPVATVTVTLNDASVGAFATDPADATASYSLTSAGAVVENGVTGGNWLTTGSATAYDVRATLVSGTFSSGTVDTWSNLGATQTWTVNRTLLGSKTCTATLEIRAVATGAVVDTATLTLTAEVETGA